MPNKPKIPSDLKPGDRLWYSETEYATVVDLIGGPYLRADGSERDATRGRIVASTRGGLTVVYWCDTGKEMNGGTSPIMRARRSPTNTKQDPDSKFLREMAKSATFPAAAKRLHTIAKRLEGGKA